MTINDRVKQVRNKLGLTQAEFGNRITLAQGYLTNIETGKREVTEKIQRLICLEFHVNEDWLRTGEGEMFIELPPATELGTYIGEILKSDDDFIKRIIINYMKLDEKSKKIVRDFIQSLGPGRKD